MVLGIYIVSDAGETIATIKLEKFDVNDALFGGIVPALDMFSSSVSGQNIRTIQMDEHKVIVHKTEKYYLVTIHHTDDSSAAKNSEKLFKIFTNKAALGITEDLIEVLRVEADSMESGMKKAEKWAKKILSL